SCTRTYPPPLHDALPIFVVACLVVIGALAGVASCKSDDNDPCPSGNCGTATTDAGVTPDAAVPKSCANAGDCPPAQKCDFGKARSEEHTSELQSPDHIVC